MAGRLARRLSPSPESFLAAVVDRRQVFVWSGRDLCGPRWGSSSSSLSSSSSSPSSLDGTASKPQKKITDCPLAVINAVNDHKLTPELCGRRNAIRNNLKRTRAFA